MGNFSLPFSQQPGPLISFGQTIIGKGHMQVDVNSYNVAPAGGAIDNLNTTLIYGLADNTALYFNIPIQSDYTTRNHHLLGLKDVTVQLEHAFYNAENARYQDQATIIGAFTIPTETSISSKKRAIPITYGAPTYFGGFTYNRTYVDWLGFISPGYLLTTTSDHLRLGSQFFYQAGIGRNILGITDRLVVIGLLELNGQYTDQDTIYGQSLPNTGGNIVTITPSLWVSTQKMIIQVGLSLPVAQNLNGTQTPMDYAFTGDFVWTFA